MITLSIRDKGLSAETVQHIKRAARMRQMSIGTYITRLVALHDAVRARADTGDYALQAELEALGLQTVIG